MKAVFLLSVLMLNAPLPKEKPEKYQLAEILDPSKCFQVQWQADSCAIVNKKLPLKDCPFIIIVDRSKPECLQKMTVQPVQEIKPKGDCDKK